MHINTFLSPRRQGQTCDFIFRNSTLLIQATSWALSFSLGVIMSLSPWTRKPPWFKEFFALFSKFPQISPTFLNFPQDSSRFVKILPNFVKFCQILPNFVKFCQISPNFHHEKGNFFPCFFVGKTWRKDYLWFIICPSGQSWRTSGVIWLITAAAGTARPVERGCPTTRSPTSRSSTTPRY